MVNLTLNILLSPWSLSDKMQNQRTAIYRFDTNSFNLFTCKIRVYFSYINDLINYWGLILDFAIIWKSHIGLYYPVWKQKWSVLWAIGKLYESKKATNGYFVNKVVSGREAHYAIASWGKNEVDAAIKTQAITKKIYIAGRNPASVYL